MSARGMGTGFESPWKIEDCLSVLYGEDCSRVSVRRDCRVVSECRPQLSLNGVETMNGSLEEGD